jgi:hypothetical protein
MTKSEGFQLSEIPALSGYVAIVTGGGLCLLLDYPFDLSSLLR